MWKILSRLLWIFGYWVVCVLVENLFIITR